MDVERVGPNQYRVGRWYLDFTEGDICYCGDAVWRSRECKHQRAVREYLKREREC